MTGAAILQLAAIGSGAAAASSSAGAIGGGAAAGSSSSRVAQVAAPATGQRGAFGFQVGEERRYAMGPAEALRPGEFERWTLRLEDVADVDGSRRAAFFYSYEYARLGGGLEGGGSERYLGSARLTVNERGFPLFVEYLPNEFNRVASGGEHNGRLTWMGADFLAEPGARSPFGPFRAPVPGADGLDPDLPEGIFLSERENPALITIPASILLGDGRTELPYVALWPTELRPGGDRRPRSRNARGLPRGRLASGPERRGLARTSLTFAGTETIEVGPRSYEATRLESRETGADVWVGRDGRLLLLETRFRNRRVFIRLLHPSEY